MSVRRRPADSAEALAPGFELIVVSHEPQGDLGSVHDDINPIGKHLDASDDRTQQGSAIIGLEVLPHRSAMLRALDQSLLISRIGSDVLNGLEDAGGIS